MSERADLLIIGNSVRYCAASAARAGLRVAAIDAFGDSDTRACARHFLRAAGMGAEALAAAAMSLSERSGAPRRLLWTAGFDGRPDQLRRLQRRFEIAGNDAAAAERVACPRRLFGLLASLGITFPPVAYAPPASPASPAGWLVKRIASSGGLGARDAADAGPDLPSDAYYQRVVRGTPVSALFAADGRSARILGYNRLRTLALPGTPYVYAGAVTWASPPAALRRAATAYARRLTRALGLRGVNGIDLLLPPDQGGAQDAAAGEPLLLELNMRPPATLELHEELTGRCGLSTHLAAVAGVLPSADAVRPRADAPAVRGLRVLYAEHALTVPALDWPRWCRDRPAAGTEIPAGAPICTVHAGGAGEADVEARLDERSLVLLAGFRDGGRRAA
ncbi:MAG: ATP-grasp domain-containing protein [Thiohalocapsa sp.]|nr:ATP-grasp domain-containing protein [Thiohalocapsa sp.]